MSDPTPSELAQAWQNATDAEVIRGIASPADYTSEALEVLQSEAHRRGIDLGAAFTQTTLEESVYLRLLSPIVRLIRVFLAFLWRHRLLAAFGYGVAFRAASGVIASHVPYIHPFLWTGFWLAAYIGGLGWLCRPLRVYKRVACIALFGFLGVATVLLADVIAFYRRFPTINSRNDVYYVVGPWIIGWLLPVALLFGVVFLRNRYSPVYLPGHCVKCGYDLQGLPEPRCPECGKPFEPQETKP
jgi:hypothetical protein